VIVHGERAIEQGSYEVSIGNRKGRDLTWLVSKRGARERHCSQATLIKRPYSHVSRPNVKGPHKHRSEK
jgi:hypothetical protein